MYPLQDFEAKSTIVKAEKIQFFFWSGDTSLKCPKNQIFLVGAPYEKFFETYKLIYKFINF